MGHAFELFQITIPQKACMLSLTATAQMHELHRKDRS